MILQIPGSISQILQIQVVHKSYFHSSFKNSILLEQHQIIKAGKMFWKSCNFHRTWNLISSIRNWTQVGKFVRTRGVEKAFPPIAAAGKWSTKTSPWTEDTNSLLCRSDNCADNDYPEHQCEELAAQGGLCHGHGLVHSCMLRLRLLSTYRVCHSQLFHQERVRVGWQKRRSRKGNTVTSIPKDHTRPCLVTLWERV